MSRLLKTSGFLGLTAQMVWGIVNTYLVMPGDPILPGYVVGAHAHFGVLGILAVVAGFAVAEFDVRGRRRRAVEWCYVTGQWLLPATLLVAVGMEMEPLNALTFLWGLLLTVSMAILAVEAWENGASGGF